VVVVDDPVPRGPLVVVSVHDVAPATATAAKRLTAALTPLGVPLTFLVIPGPWRGARFGDPGDDGQDLLAWLRDRQDHGDEISLHGWLHRADVPGGPLRRIVGNLAARGAGELWALDRKDSATRAGYGLRTLAAADLTVTGCTPPGWLASRAARAGLADVGLGYITDHTGVTDLRSGRRWWAPALCQRPAGGSIRSGDVPIPGAFRMGPARAAELAGRAVVAAAPLLVHVGRSVRLGLHPTDLDRAHLVEGVVVAVRRCLAAGAIAVTYQQAMTRLLPPV
jgi:predicted deacetylase